MAKLVMEGSPDDILQHMLQSNYIEHDNQIYPRLDVLREIYSRDSKSQLETGKEIAVILPAYENISSVRRTLTNGGLDVSRFKKDESLVILDSVKGYFESNHDIPTTNDILLSKWVSKYKIQDR